MCTLTLAWQVFDDVPIAVAANRDESLDRESFPPGIYSADPVIVAPRDADAGGTWIGYNEYGLFVGITNKWTDTDLASDRSRGLLVADILECSSATAAAELLEEETGTREYDGFYLVVADANDAVCYAWDGDLTRTEFDPGVHVVVNAAVDDEVDAPPSRRETARAQADNARAVRRELATSTGETASKWLERAGGILGDHEYGVCLHHDGFGTRSSSLLSVGETGSYRFAAGPPCRTRYESIDLERTEGSGNLEGHI
ncbi:hypothetical protein D8Y22_10285 [Salinadaptatus halalkaliphilus]|uniref:NRDE family protein n=1 Tax=Salinadaptatus halalkaliphilus TaxID=2419781 RepID=A0A4S3TMY6_9EURY|nr:NRDE family protein [Salinadaptatus halalkaliphilus]THE64990.1 hypothetical protein D8Y22_10285 [Salinadaptatus halalkaliphilus]